MTSTRRLTKHHSAAALILGIALVAAVIVSLFIGAGELSSRIVTLSRVPRTAAAVLAGSALAVSGLIMQLLVRNRFVEPSTVGSTEAAAAGFLIAALVFPGIGIGWVMVIATITALAGTLIYLALISRLAPHDYITVPLVGIIYGGVISAGTTFVAVQTDLSQSLQAWQVGSFDGVIKDRYELLWVVLAASIAAWVMADRLTIMGLGGDTARGLGLNERGTETAAIVIVAVVAAVTVTVVGILPFIGLVVPNIVRWITGDNARRAIPWTAAVGALATLLADLAARLLIYPFELPVGSILGVTGACVFLGMLAHQAFGRRMKRTKVNPA